MVSSVPSGVRCGAAAGACREGEVSGLTAFGGRRGKGFGEQVELNLFPLGDYHRFVGTAFTWKNVLGRMVFGGKVNMV